MRIENYLNTNKEEVEARKHNIWIGISLGNRCFSKENIQKYIEWALEYTSTDVLVVIADSLHALNIEVLEKRTSESALAKAMKMGDGKYQEIQDILGSLGVTQQTRVKVAHWEEAVNSERYQSNLDALMRYYNSNEEFRRLIMDIIKDGRKDRLESINNLPREKLDRLAEYVLNEIPPMVNGLEFAGKVYTLLPYPGLTELDDLCVGLNNRRMFKDLANDLNPTNKVSILDAWVE